MEGEKDKGGRREHEKRDHPPFCQFMSGSGLSINALLTIYLNILIEQKSGRSGKKNKRKKKG